MKTMLSGGRVWRADHSFLLNCPIVVEDQTIVSVGDPNFPHEREIDLSGKTVIPGLVDVHTHGRGGYDFCTATEEQLREMKTSYAKSGVTSLFPTLASATVTEWLSAIKKIQAVGFDGIHLEGRYLNPAKRGAHAPELLAPLTPAELSKILSAIDLPCHLTAAFELDENGEFAATALREGATLGLGHTAATAEETKLALTRGVTAFTHLFNAMPPLHHRDGGPVSVALNGKGFAELIVDGLHVCPDMVKLAYRCLGKDRTVLITDSMEATDCPDGNYQIAGQPVKVKNGRAETVDGALAGSTLSLLDGVKNLIKFADVPQKDAVACATINPAREVGIDKTVGSIDEGKRADLVITDENLNLLAVIFHGEFLKGEMP